jgi:hypothetical protein
VVLVLLLSTVNCLNIGRKDTTALDERQEDDGLDCNSLLLQLRQHTLKSARAG